jgi:twitching motility protein PilT
MDIDHLLQFAVKHGISDVHVRVGRPPYFRKDGQLVTRKNPVEITEAQMAAWFKRMTTERLQEEFGSLSEVDFAYNSPGHGRFRVNAYRQQNVTAMVLRHIPTELPTLEHLGLPAVIADIAMAPRGIILVTGATGSGKSTTLAAMVQTVNAQRACHVLTIEDPVEFVFPNAKAMISQREIGADTVCFPSAMRAALRQDPDVILIGELRDLETVETALHAAETGHLVMTTLHTVDAMETVGRLISLFPPHQHEQVRYQLSTILRAVISQRLVRTIKGGRIAACEILVHTEFIRELIADASRTHELPMAIAQGKDVYGMQTFDQALADLVKRHVISKPEALLYATNPSDLKLRFEGIAGN